jgi:hypothetical protein
MQNMTARQAFKHLLFDLILLTLLFAPLASAQQQSSIVPTLVNFSGTLTQVNGKTIGGTAGVTFYLYKDQQGGAPLWIETQNVQPDKYGHYTVMLGATKSQGLPTDLFASGEARWLGVQAEGQVEQPRVMLLAVPYALKAGDAQTVGGLPPSAFVLAAPSAVGGNGAPSASSSPLSASSPGVKPPVGGTGTLGYLAGWVDNNGDLGNSVLYQLGTGSTAKIGLNLKTPLASLDIQGTELVRGLFESATTGTATATKGFNSNATDMEASSFNSGTNAAVMQHFEWQAEPTGNNTTTPGASLNLLFATNSNKPAETGLLISNTGAIQSTNNGQSITATMSGNNGLTAAILGNTTATGNGSTIGVQGNSLTNRGYGIFGTANYAGVYGQGGTYGILGNSTGGFGTYGGSVFSDGIHGLSTNGNGVYGIGGSNGVYGQTSGGSAVGVSGVNTVSGYGVMGKATGTSGQGVWGESFGTSFSNGSGADGVHGVAHSNEGAGVAGINSATDGTGIYGSDTGGYGFVTDSHTSQSRSMGGWVKAMVYFEPTTGGGIRHCFNSQIAGSSAATPPCGITFFYNSPGDYTLDFGFEVDDRFVSLTEQNASASTESWLCRGNCFVNPNANQIDVFVCDDNNPCNLGDRLVGLFVVVY